MNQEKLWSMRASSFLLFIVLGKVRRSRSLSRKRRGCHCHGLFFFLVRPFSSPIHCCFPSLPSFCCVAWVLFQFLRVLPRSRLSRSLCENKRDACNWERKERAKQVRKILKYYATIHVEYVPVCNGTILTDERRPIPLFEYFALKELLSRPLGLYAGVGATLWQAQPSIPLLKLFEGSSTFLHGGTKSPRYGLDSVVDAAEQRARGR